MIKKIPEEFRKYSQIKKIKFHCGIGHIRNDPEAIKYFEKQFEIITNQKPKKIFSKRMISGFDLREKTQIGFCVTLRKKKMYQIYHNLISIYLPNTYSFKGIQRKNFDKLGNFTFGIKSFNDIHLKEMEHPYQIMKKYRNIGFSVSVITYYNNINESIKYIRSTGILFKDENN